MADKNEIDVQLIEGKPGKQSKHTKFLRYDLPLRNTSW